MLKVDYKFYDNGIILYFKEDRYTIAHYYFNSGNLLLYRLINNSNVTIEEYLNSVGLKINEISYNDYRY